MQHDDTGKVQLDHIYTRPDPRPYFTALAELDYSIPGVAQPLFAELQQEFARARGRLPRQVLDVGCSYGINAVLMKCDTTLEELYTRYGDPDAVRHSPVSLIVADQDFLRRRARRRAPRVVGLDTSDAALDYARATGFLDAAVHADLESAEPTDDQRDLLRGTDLVVSTGCVGYVSEKTLLRVVDAATDVEADRAGVAAGDATEPPWMAHFCLRMFPFDPIAESLATRGYETEAVPGVFRQRRFASAREQQLVIERLTELGVDPAGLETEGWFYAQLFVSRPSPRRAA